MQIILKCLLATILIVNALLIIANLQTDNVIINDVKQFLDIAYHVLELDMFRDFINNFER